MKAKTVPQFKNEDEEREFWNSHDVLDYVDMENMIINPQLPNLKSRIKSVNLRLPVYLLNDIKEAARFRDLPYQAFMKVLLQKGLTEFLHEHHYRAS